MSGSDDAFRQTGKDRGARRRCRVFDLQRRGRRDLRPLRQRDRDQLRARILLPRAVRPARARRTSQAIVVDLSDCAQSRGIVEALPSADLTVDEPDTEFMISHARSSHCLQDQARGCRTSSSIPPPRSIWTAAARAKPMDPERSSVVSKDIVPGTIVRERRCARSGCPAARTRAARTTSTCRKAPSPIPGASEWTENLFTERDWRVFVQCLVRLRCCASC